MRYWRPKFDGVDCSFFRLGGPGLGNLLFPWARAHLMQHKFGGKVLRPVWGQIKLGPILRNEPDKRSYFGQFMRGEHEAEFAETLMTRFHRSAIAEDAFDAGACEESLVEFSGMKNLFAPLYGHRDIILERFCSIIRSFNTIQVSTSPYIAVHVRLGDFAAPKVGAGPEQGKTNTRIQIEWYRGALEHTRDYLGDSRIPAKVFSDGTDSELAALLATPGTTRAAFAPAAHHILAMSRGIALVASGSTFSMWSSFFGQQMTVWYPGQHRQRLHNSTDTEVEFRAEDASFSRSPICIK
jgi:hypothetical protein